MNRKMVLLVVVGIAAIVAAFFVGSSADSGSGQAPSASKPEAGVVTSSPPCPEGQLPDGVLAARFGRLCMQLPPVKAQDESTQWLYQSDLSNEVSKSYTVCGGAACTQLILYKAQLDATEFITRYGSECVEPIAFKDDVMLGNDTIPARYYEGTKCGENAFFDRIWWLPGKGIAIVARSPYPGSLNGVDKILLRYTGWKAQ